MKHDSITKTIFCSRFPSGAFGKGKTLCCFSRWILRVAAKSGNKPEAAILHLLPPNQNSKGIIFSTHSKYLEKYRETNPKKDMLFLLL